MAAQDYTSQDNIVQEALENGTDSANELNDPAPKRDVVLDEIERYGEAGAPLPELVEEAYPVTVNANGDQYAALLGRTRAIVNELMVDDEVTGTHLEPIENHTDNLRDWATYREVTGDDLIEVIYRLD